MDISQRKEELSKELGKYSLEIRKDSRLCYCYIHDNLNSEWDLQKVVYEICITNWLFNYTDYKLRCDYAFKYFSHMFNNKTVGHTYVKNFIQPQIKIDTINQMGGLPKIWPWIT